MVDLQTVCCMCGDVGFPDKLFRCSKCSNRFQHSYCSNYYAEVGPEAIVQCDWCESEERSSSSSSRHAKLTIRHESSSKSSCDKIMKQQQQLPHDHHQRNETLPENNKLQGKSPSPRPTTRRYKLLKDVMS